VEYDYSYDGIMRSMEDSFQRLGLAKIDILFVHDIGVYQHGEQTNAAHMKVLRESGYRALEELRRTGAVSAIGLGVNEKEVLIEVLKFGDWDVFLLLDVTHCWSRHHWMTCCRCAASGARPSSLGAAEFGNPGRSGHVELCRGTA